VILVDTDALSELTRAAAAPHAVLDWFGQQGVNARHRNDGATAPQRHPVCQVGSVLDHEEGGHTISPFWIRVEPCRITPEARRVGARRP
jgi:hypothetical protein